MRREIRGKRIARTDAFEPGDELFVEIEEELMGILLLVEEREVSAESAIYFGDF